MAKKVAPKQTTPVTAAQSIEMTLEQSKAYRASLHVPAPKPMNEVQRREAFRVWWTSHKKKYGKSGKLELALWFHLKATGMDHPEKFEAGIFNFGLKKVK